MKLTIIAITLVHFALLANAQEFSVPSNYQFKTVEDINAAQPDIRACMSWLETTPLNEQVAKRKEANAFFMAWLTVTPSVKVTVQPFLMDLVDKNTDLLMLFFVGWTRHSLDNPDQIKDAEINTLNGMESLISYYTSNLKSGIKKDKKVEKLKEMSSDELLDWVKAQL